MLESLPAAVLVSNSQGKIEFANNNAGHGDFAVVSVADQGRGIPEEKLIHIFESFQQVEKSDALVERGYGLGLAICKAIVEKHGGKLGVQSTVGKGSTFWFSLPL